MPTSILRSFLASDNVLEVSQYDPWVLRETLHNCIAHQDYNLRALINVVGLPTSLLITNAGSFIPGTVEEMIRSDAPPEIYCNPFLARRWLQNHPYRTVLDLAGKLLRLCLAH